ncbi:MAG: Fur family transcriptional regulator [Chloroflexaceae bacterium]
MPHCQTSIETLRRRGYRITPQRALIIEAIAHNCQHMTAEEIFARVQQRTPGVNIATIYRTLDFLVKEGLAHRADLGGGQVIYATIQHGPHIHLVCRQCGTVIEADARLIAALRVQLQQQYGFAADLQHFALSGLCRDCQEHFETE